MTPKTLPESLASSTANASKPAPSTAPPQSPQSSKSKTSRTNSKVVGYWLLGSAASVFGIVIFGGLTRLTESGYVGAASDWVGRPGLLS